MDPVPLLQLKRSLSKTYGSSPTSSYRVSPTQHLEALSKTKGLYQAQLLHDSQDLTEYIHPVPGETLAKGVVLKEKYLVLEQMSERTWKILHLEWKRTLIAKKVDTALVKDSKVLEAWSKWCTLPQQSNIAEAYYLEELEQDQQYLLQEFLNPCSLLQVLADHQFEEKGLEEVLSTLAMDLAEALDHAHRHGLLHLNLTPGNVLLFSAGKGFGLTDFGNPVPLTKSRLVWSQEQDRAFAQLQKNWPSELLNLYSKANRTRSRRQYQEQLELYELLADSKADIFSYGVILLTMIVGSQTWNSTSQLFPEVVDELVEDSMLLPSAKHKYASLIKRAMYDIEETGQPQFLSMAEVLQEVRSMISPSYPMLSARQSPLPLQEFALNKRALLLFALEAWEDAMHLWNDPRFQSPEWRFNLYVSHWLFGSATDMEVLNALPHPSESQLVRIHMMRQDWVEASKHVLFDACQNDLSYGLLRDAREIHWNKSSFQPYTIYSSRHEKKVQEVVVISHGLLIAVHLSSGIIVVIDSVKSTVKQEFSEGNCSCISGCWEKAMIACGRSTSDIVIFDLARGKTIESGKEHAGPVRIIRITQDGEKAISIAGDRFVYLWQTAHAIILHKVWFESPPTAISIDGSGSRAALSLAQKTYVRVIDIKREFVSDHCLLQGHKLEVTAVAMANDGAVCVTAGLDAKIMFWEVENKLPFLTIRYNEPIVGMRATPSLEFLVVKLRSRRCCLLESGTSITWRTLETEGELPGFNLFLTQYRAPSSSIESFPILKCETEMQLKKVFST